MNTMTLEDYRYEAELDARNVSSKLRKKEYRTKAERCLLSDLTYVERCLKEGLMNLEKTSN